MTDSSAGRPATGALHGASGEPSLVSLVASGVVDAELAAVVWFLVDGGIPLVVAAPPTRLAAGTQLLAAAVGSVRADPSETTMAVTALDRPGAWQLVHGGRAGAVVGAGSLQELRDALARPPFQLSPQELTFLGCVLVASAPAERPTGRLRVTAAHYVRPLARDAHGHAQELPPAVLATWDARLGRYEQFAWGVLPEIAARLGRRVGDLEADLHHRRDDLGGLAQAGLTSLAEVRRLIAGYRMTYGAPHGDNRQT